MEFDIFMYGVKYIKISLLSKYAKYEWSGKEKKIRQTNILGFRPNGILI